MERGKKLIIYGILCMAFLVVINPIFMHLGHTALTSAMMRIDHFPEIFRRMTMLQHSFSLSSTAFAPNGLIPSRYTCDGEDLNPPLSIGGTPSDTLSLALIVEDPDVPRQLKPDGTFLHWLVYNIPPAVTEILEGTHIGAQGLNSSGTRGYIGPCPPPQYEPREHRYLFTLYALDTTLNLPEGATKAEVLAAMQDHVIAETHLTGLYRRNP
jgi:hypothetical protein